MTKLLLPILLLSLEGCAALGPVNQFLTTQKNPIVQAGIDLAVGTAVGSNPATMKVKAAAIKAIAQAILLNSANPKVTVAALEATLNQTVGRMAPNPADLAAFMILTSTLEAYLNGYIQTNAGGPVTAQTLIAIQGLANAVVTATSFYGV